MIPIRLLPLLLCVITPLGRADDVLLTHGNIYTGDDSLPRADAVLVRDGRIAFVGGTSEAAKLLWPAARVIDLHGRTVLPGLTDSHVHLAGIGFRELEFNLEGTTGIADLQARLRARAAQTDRTKWIIGRGWIETHWSPAAFPTAADLDAIVSDQPVCLSRSDGHAIVVNSFALKLAGIDRSTPNPSGGEILRDPKTGVATGMLIDRAKALVEHLIPAHSADEVAHALEVGAARELSLGWTQVQVAGSDLGEVAALHRLVASGKIKLRIYDAVSGPGPAADELLKTGVQREGDGSRLTVRGIKLYSDGALGSRGAALLAPYSDSPASTGLLVSDPDKLFPLLVAALRKGVQVETHAIGDRGNRFVLDLYEKAFAAVPPAERAVRDPRWRIEHAQILDAADLPRFAKLGVIASMQPSHAIGDLYFAPKRLGPERLAGAYAWRTLLDSGATLIGGSDAPVERGEPLIEFYAAVARQSLDGFSNADWHREQRLSRAQALRMFTSGPAFAAFQEDNRGMIAIGKAGDFSVFADDIMAIAEPEILKTRCVLTIVGGEVVYEAK